MDLNTLNVYGWNIFHYACEKGDLEIVKFLFDKKLKVDIHCQTKSRDTAIQLAAISRQWDIVKELVNAKGEVIDLNVLDRYGKIILHHACRSGNLETVKLLLGKRPKVDINRPNISGVASIQLAAMSQNLELLDFLFIQNDLDMQEDPIEWTFDLALRHELVDLLSALFSGGRILLGGDYVNKLRSWFRNHSVTLEMKNGLFFNNIKYFLELDDITLGEIYNSVDYNASINLMLDASEIGERLADIFEVVSKLLLNEKWKTGKLADYQKHMFSEAIKYLVEKVTKTSSKDEICSFLLEEKEGSKLPTNQRKVPDQIKVRFGERFSTIVKDESLRIPDDERALFDKLFDHVVTDDAKIVLISKLIEVGLVLNGPTGLIEDKGERDWYINRYVTHYRWGLDKMPELRPFLFSELIDPKFAKKDRNVKDAVVDVDNYDVDGKEGAMEVSEEGWVEDGNNIEHMGTRKRRRKAPNPKPEHEHESDRHRKRRT